VEVGGVEENSCGGQDFEQRVGPDLRQQILAQGDCSSSSELRTQPKVTSAMSRLADRRRDALDAFAIGWKYAGRADCAGGTR